MAGIIIYHSEDLHRYVPFIFQDDTAYDAAKKMMLSEEGVRKYGMKFVSGRNAPIEKLDKLGEGVPNLVERLNSGEKLNTQKELEAISI